MNKPTHAQCKVLAGDPLFLAASHEESIRQEWKRMERVYRAAMKWYRAQAYRDRTEANAALLRACAAARKMNNPRPR